MPGFGRARGVGAALLSVFAVTAFGVGPAHAQTHPSLRIQSLDPIFAGIVDDEITDAWGNPARVGAIDDRSVYTGRFSDRAPYLAFPTFSANYSQLPLEQLGSNVWQTDYYATDPFAATVFTTVGHGMHAAVSVDAAVYGNDAANNGNRVSDNTRWVGQGISIDEQASASQRDSNRLVLDLALGSAVKPDRSSKGVRLHVEYRDREGTDVWVDNVTEFPTTDPSQLVSDYSASRNSSLGKELRAEITGGVYRPRSVLRDVALTMGVLDLKPRYRVLRQDVFDEDQDGDGADPAGFPPDYEYHTVAGESSRHYTGGGGGARLVLAWGERVRSVHRVDVSVLKGNSNATAMDDDISSNAGNETSFHESIGYSGDGTVTLVSTSSAVGFSEHLREDVLVAAAASGYYSRDEIDEDASGSGDVTQTGSGSSSALSADYTQRNDIVEEQIRATVALAVEWQVTPYAALRFGVSHHASHDKVDGTLMQNIKLDGQPGLLASGDNQIQYTTGTEFRTGIGVTLADRLTVDLQAVGGTVSLAQYAYATALYRF